jgi:hypothetical protein
MPALFRIAPEALEGTFRDCGGYAREAGISAEGTMTMTFILAHTGTVAAVTAD